MKDLSLESMIEKNESKIGIIGLGYVGMPLTLRFSEVGFKTFGFDVDNKKINSLNKKKSYIDHISDESIEALYEQDFSASTEFQEHFRN